MKRPLILLVAVAAVGLLLLSAQPASAQIGVSIGHGGVSVGVGHGHVGVSVGHGYVPYRSSYSSYSSHSSYYGNSSRYGNYGGGHYTTRRYVQPRIVVPQYRSYHYQPPCIHQRSYGYGQGYGGGGYHY